MALSTRAPHSARSAARDPISRPAQARQDGRLEAQARAFAQDPARRLQPAAHQGATEQALVPGLGHPLPAALRAALQPRLGIDLSTLRVHDDAAAAQQADEAGANAYTQGRDIVLGRGQGQGAGGARLLAHEVAHAAQQAQPGAQPGVQREPRPGDGIGRHPPSDSFVEMDLGDSGVEDDHVLFARNDAVLDERDRTTLDALAASAGEGAAVHVHGYASQEGDADYNLNLSAHRAVAVKQYLQGVMPEGTRITAYAYGASTAFGEGSERQGQNRRVGVDVIEAGGLFNPGLSPRFAGTLLPPGGLRLGGPTVPPPVLPQGLPSLTDDLAFGPQRLAPYRSPLPGGTMPPLPSAPRFDVGSVAADFALRGVPYTERDAASLQAHYQFWYGNFTRWGMAPDLADWLVQKGTAAAARTDLSLQAPTDQELLDRAMGTSPTIVPLLNDSMMRWLFDRFSRDH